MTAERTPCTDCDVDTLRSYEWYVVGHAIWEQASTITVTGYRIAPCRYIHLANRLKEAPPCHAARQSARAGVFEADGYRLYRRLVAAAARRAGTAVWAYCLMPN